MNKTINFKNTYSGLALKYFLTAALVVMLAAACGSAAPGAAQQPPEGEDAGSEAREAFLPSSDFSRASAVIDEFLKSLLESGSNYERFVTTEIGGECVNNFYMIDRHIIKNYKRAITVNGFGEASCVYDGDGETIKQEFNLVKNAGGELKINSISEKRYIKMNDARRQCYLNSRAVYKAASLLQVLYEDMQLPAKVDFELLKTKGLLADGVSCPRSAEITLSVDRNNDSQNYEVIARCSMHGDFFELYKLDDKLAMNFDKYNAMIDKDEEAILNRIGGVLYKAFLKIQPVEDAFYAQYEKQNTAEMFKLLNQALTIDKRLGNMYITLIRAYRAAGNEKSAREIFDMAAKVYPGWAELSNALSEKQVSPDGDDIED
jgi:hypothetical protein